jgi:hypothetical protein
MDIHDPRGQHRSDMTYYTAQIIMFLQQDSWNTILFLWWQDVMDFLIGSVLLNIDKYDAPVTKTNDRPQKV